MAPVSETRSFRAANQRQTKTRPIRRPYGTLFEWARRLLAIIGLIVILVSFTPLDFWWARLLAHPDADARGDVLVLLGANSSYDGVIGDSSYLRSEYAVWMWREGRFRSILISGGTGNPSYIPAALSMAAFLRSQGVPGTKITMELQSSSTRENALFSAPILAKIPGRKVLVTSDYHMFRAYRAFRKAGVDVIASPIPDAAKRAGAISTRWSAFTDLSQETVKIAYYYLRGWI